jgi:hypothetical protein
MSISNNNSLTSLKGLNNLTAVWGDVFLQNNPVLSRLSDLTSLNDLGNTLTVTNNPELAICAVKGICIYLQNNTPDMVLFSGNDNGCNSEAEVESQCGALPVTLIDFAVAKNEHAVDLRWSTSSEVNSSHFEIQHSPNAGRSWEIVGNVQANKESYEEKRYAFTHQAPSKGENLYRLKMIDRDGTFAFSRIRSVTFDDLNAFSVYPNPVQDQLTVETGSGIKNGRLRVYNAAGKMITSKEVNFSGKPYQLETSQLPAGIYTIQLMDGPGKKEVQKFLKLPL